MRPLLVAIDCYERFDHLLLNLERLRRLLPPYTSFVVFKNGKNELRLPANITLLTAENTGHHNGVRDACNHVLPLVSEFETVVRLHSDSHIVTVEPLLDAISYIRSDEIISAIPQAGYEGVVHDPCMTRMIHRPDILAPHINCHLWIARSSAYKSMLPLHVNCDANDGKGRAEDGYGTGIEVALAAAATRAGLTIRARDIPIVTDNDFETAKRRLRDQSAWLP